MSDLRPGTTMYRIAELERVTREQRQDIRELRGALELAEDRIAALERSTPEARQLQYEADVAAADLAEPGYDLDPPVGTDRHGVGCHCPYCYDPEEVEESPLARRDAYIGTWSGQDVTRREGR